MNLLSESCFFIGIILTVAALLYRDKPPTKGVVAVNTSFVRVKRPESFKVVWPPTPDYFGDFEGSVQKLAQDITTNDREQTCSIWFPEAPKGYVAMGCVVSPGRKQPPVSSAYCISATLVSTCGLRDCISIPLSSRYVNSLLSFVLCLQSHGTWL